VLWGGIILLNRKVKKDFTILKGEAMFLCLLVFALITSIPAALYGAPAPPIVYVATDGNNNNPGTEALPWETISYAAEQAKAGDTVYIKGGNYGNEHVVIENSGTAENPIIFEGYKNVPGDIPEPEWLDIHRQGGHNPPTVNSGEMPLIDGSNITGTGIYIESKEYVEIRNIQVVDYGDGIWLQSTNNIILNNIIVKSTGRYGIFLYSVSDCKV
jgi:parallel beta-helix repeat protein